MAKSKKDDKPESQDEGNENENAQPEAQEDNAPQSASRSVTEDDLSIGDTQIGFSGEHITLKVDPAHPLHDKLVGRTVSLPVLFTSAE